MLEELGEGLTGLITAILGVVGTYYAKIKKKFDKVDGFDLLLNGDGKKQKGLIEKLEDLTDIVNGNPNKKIKGLVTQLEESDTTISDLQKENSDLKDFKKSCNGKFEDLIRVDDRVKALFKMLEKIDTDVEKAIDKSDRSTKESIKELWRVVRENEEKFIDKLDRKQDK
jgi:DNA repair ATPase RecN